MSVEDLVFICLFDDLKEKALSCGQGGSVNVNTNWQIIKYGDKDKPHIISMYGFKYLKFRFYLMMIGSFVQFKLLHPRKL